MREDSGKETVLVVSPAASVVELEFHHGWNLAGSTLPPCWKCTSTLLEVHFSPVQMYRR